MKIGGLMGPPIFLFPMEESTTHRVTLNNSDINYNTFRSNFTNRMVQDIIC